MSDPIIYRTCKKCQQSLPVTSEFWHKDKTSKDGFSYACKECAKARSRKWKHDNQEYANEQARDYYATHKQERREYLEENAERVAAGKRRWRQNNPDKVAEHKKRNYDKQKEHYRNYKARWYQLNRKRIRSKPVSPEQRKEASERSCRWAKLNPEKSLNHSHMRRARIKSNGGAGFFKADRELQMKAQGGNCWWCGKPMGDDVTIEHIRPIVRGGMHDPRNIVLVHKSCNCSKKDKLPHEWNGRLL